MGKIVYFDKMVANLGVLKERTEPQNPPNGKVYLYVDKSDKHIKTKDSRGNKIDLTKFSEFVNKFTSLNIGSNGNWTFEEADNGNMVLKYNGVEKRRWRQ